MIGVAQMRGEVIGVAQVRGEVIGVRGRGGEEGTEFPYPVPVENE